MFRDIRDRTGCSPPFAGAGRRRRSAASSGGICWLATRSRRGRCPGRSPSRLCAPAMSPGGTNRRMPLGHPQWDDHADSAVDDAGCTGKRLRGATEMSSHAREIISAGLSCSQSCAPNRPISQPLPGRRQPLWDKTICVNSPCLNRATGSGTAGEVVVDPGGDPDIVSGVGLGR